MSDEIEEGTASGYVVVETTAIAQIAQVRVYDETLPHLGEGHPELSHVIPSLEHAIHDTISQPSEVYESNPPHVASYKYRSENHSYGNNHMVVAVKVVEGTSALLKTVYFSSEVKGTLVWRQQND